MPKGILRLAMPARHPAHRASTVRNNSVKQRLTPKCDHEQLDHPTCADLIDVFEDAWTGYVLDQVKLPLTNPDGDMAAMTLLSFCFESIEALQRGESGDQESPLPLRGAMPGPSRKEGVARAEGMAGQRWFPPLRPRIPDGNG